MTSRTLQNDKRRSPRSRVHCAVLLNHPLAGSARYSIENFSRSGLFATPERGAETHLAALPADERLTVTVDDDCHDGDLVSVPAIIVRSTRTGVAVKFPQDAPAEELVTILEVLADGVANDELLCFTDRRRSQLWNTLVEAARLTISHTVEVFLGNAPKALLDAARSAPDIQQDILFEVLERLGKRSKDIKNNVLQLFSHAFPKDVMKLSPALEGRQTATRTQGGELSLLDDEDFDHWLSATGMVTKLERKLRDPLRALTQRVRALVEQDLNAERMPLGPNVLGRLLIAELITPHTNHVALEQELIECLEESLLEPLFALYGELNLLLEKNGYSAQEESFKVSRRESHLGTAGHARRAPGGQGSDSYPGPAPLRPAASGEGPSIQPPYPPGLDTAPAQGATGDPSSLAVDAEYLQPGFWDGFSSPAGTVAGPAIPVSGSQTSPSIPRGEAVDVVMDFLSSLRAPAAPLARGERSPVFHDKDVLRALEGFKEKTPRAMARLDADGFGTALRRALGPPKNKRIEDQHLAAINSVFALLKTLGKEGDLSDRAQSWLKQTLIPLLKTAINDPRWLADENNPARDLVNALGRLDELLLGADKVTRDALSGTVEALLKQLQKEKRHDLKLLKHVARIVASIADAQSEQQQQKKTEIVSQLQQEDQEIVAANAVDQHLLEIFGEEPVPSVVLDLLDAGWLRVLALAYRKRDEDSAYWQASLKVIERVLKRIKSPSVTPDHLDMQALAELKFISRGLQSVGVAKATARKLSDALAGVLLAGGGRTPQKPATGTYQPAAPDQSGDLDAAGMALGHWLRFCREMPVGTELELANGDETIRCSLLWISADGSRVALADRKTDGVRQISLKELAEHFQQRSAMVCSEPNLPLVDQGLYRLLHKTYDELAHQATHDELTDLINRKEFVRILEQAASTAVEPGKELMLCHLSIDEFQLINSACGLEGGDQFLRELAGTLNEMFPAPAGVGRLGGNEFGVMVPLCGERAGMKRLAELRTTMAEKGFRWEKTRHSVSLSIGVALSTEAGMPAGTLLKNADGARGVAKNKGGNRIHLYGTGKATSRREKLMSWVARIDDALHHDRLMLRCQRIQPIKDGMRPHYEVLIGIKDADGISVPPDKFIAAAETFNRMQAVDRWIITRVFAMMRSHSDSLEKLGGLSINLSGISLSDEQFCEFLLNELYTTDIRREKVIFEITETAAISDMDNVVPFISEIRQLGCRFALDDFGTGLTSYAYLRNLPVDFLKIDGCFIRDLGVNADDAALVKSINEIGHFMDKKVIAEYVENDRILDVLRTIGVDYAQGYGIEKPRLLTEVLYAA